MASRRFTRLTNGFSKRADYHLAAVGLFVAHFNFCRVHEALRVTPAMAQRLTDHVWTIGELLSACLDNAPAKPRKVPSAVPGNPRRSKISLVAGGLHLEAIWLRDVTIPRHSITLRNTIL
jgi:hypothetical protein